VGKRFQNIDRTRRFLRTPDGRARFIALLTLGILLLVWWQAMVWYRSQLLTEQRLRATEEVSLRGSALSAAINRRFALLRGLNAFVRTEYDQGDFSAQFLVFASNLYANTSGIHTIAVAPGGLIQHIYPLAGNETLIGYDLLHALQPELKEDIELAIETEEIILGLPLDYAQGEWGLAARQAIYLEDGTFWGLISIVIDIPTLLNDAGLDVESPDLDFMLVDRSGELIYETGPIMGQEGVSYQLGLPEEPWKLTGFPKKNWDIIIRGDLLPVQISGLISVLLMSGLVYISVNRQARLSSAVQQRTHEIAQINRTLEHRVAARTREITTLLEVSQNVATMPDVQPLLSLILDQLQSIVTCFAASIFLVESESELCLLNYRGPISPEDLPTRWTLEGADHFLEVIRTRKPVIIPDVRSESRLALAWQRSIKTHLKEIPEYVACWMGIPLVVKKRVIGLLVLHHEVANFFTDEQASLAMAFAHQAALAIENARLYEQAQQVAVLRERQRLARELHDSVSQALYSIALGARTTQTLVQRELDPGIKSRLAEPIEHVISMAEAGLAEMRALIFELRPESLENEGLIAALTKQAAALQARNQLDVQVNLCDEPEVSFEIKLLFYRIAQESLHNVVKHAQARHVRLELSCQADWIKLSIRDDGQGFDISPPTQGLGLHSMRERVEGANGVFQVDSAPGEGTLVVAQIPIETGEQLA
jgi:signal transduction histidine kinase